MSLKMSTKIEMMTNSSKTVVLRRKRKCVAPWPGVAVATVVAIMRRFKAIGVLLQMTSRSPTTSVFVMMAVVRWKKVMMVIRFSGTWVSAALSVVK